MNKLFCEKQTCLYVYFIRAVNLIPQASLIKLISHEIDVVDKLSLIFFHFKQQFYLI
jgi:hypothetical protein